MFYALHKVAFPQLNLFEGGILATTGNRVFILPLNICKFSLMRIAMVLVIHNVSNFLFSKVTSER